MAEISGLLPKCVREPLQFMCAHLLHLDSETGESTWRGSPRDPSDVAAGKAGAGAKARLKHRYAIGCPIDTHPVR